MPIHGASRGSASARERQRNSAMFSFRASVSHRLLFALILGIIGALGMPPVGWAPALAFSLSGFWFVLTSFDKTRSAAFSGFLYGLGYFTAGLWWIGNALLIDGNPYLWAWPLAVLGLPTLLALYPALAAYLVHRFFGGKSFASWLGFCAVMALSEWGRGHAFTGFPWNLAGMVWTDNLPMLQSLSVIGIYGLSLLTIVLLSAPGFAFAGAAQQRARIAVMAAVFLIGGSLWMGGEYRLARNPTLYNKDVAVRIVQPNIPQGEKWQGDLFWQNFEKTLRAIAPQDEESRLPAKIRIAVLPETALHFGLFENTETRGLLAEAMAAANVDTLLSGALLRSPGENGEPRYHNSLIALDRSAQIVASFDKFHLVPFGEYMPLEDYIPLGPIVGFSGFVKGPGPRTLTPEPSVPPFSPLVCYEVIFPGAVISKMERPLWIVNATNDAWYGISPGPYQHLGHAVYRAIEEGLPLARSANTGISAMIDPYGRIIVKNELLGKTSSETYLPLPANPTIFSFWKDGFFFAFTGIFLALAAYIRISKFRAP
jgi:apolipoprotein N-acyltransferase